MLCYFARPLNLSLHCPAAVNHDHQECRAGPTSLSLPYLFALLPSLFSPLYYIYIYIYIRHPPPPLAFPSQTQPGRFNFIGSTSPEAFLSWLPLQVCFNFRGSTNNRTGANRTGTINKHKKKLTTQTQNLGVVRGAALRLL